MAFVGVFLNSHQGGVVRITIISHGDIDVADLPGHMDHTNGAPAMSPPPNHATMPPSEGGVPAAPPVGRCDYCGRHAPLMPGHIWSAHRKVLRHFCSLNCANDAQAGAE